MLCDPVVRVVFYFPVGVGKREKMNEILLMGSVVLIYGMVLLAYRLFGKAGMYLMTVVATILANIEVLLLVDAFGMNQTLGNVLFASTYLVTDILSENEGKKAAARAVWMGVFTSALMLVFTQYWLLYTPSGSDWAMPAVKTIFQTTPRLMFASFLGYVVSQRLDVWLYHRLWDFTAAKTGDAGGLLWLRNNFATLLSQVINTVIFTSVAFGGWYPMEELVGIMLSSYLIFIFTSLLDTPVVYLARRMKKAGRIPGDV